MWRYFIILAAAIPLFGAKYAGEPFSFGLGGRALGLGNSYVSLADDPSSVYWNPAGLKGSSSREILLMHSDAFGGIVRMDFVSILFPELINKINVGLGLYLLTSPDIKQTALRDSSKPITPSNLSVVGELTYNVRTLYLSGALQSHIGNIGLTVKILQEDLAVEHGLGIGIDLGYQKLGEHLGYGVVVRDVITTPILWSSGKREYIVPSARLGMYIRRDENLTFTADLQVFFENRQFASPIELGPVSFEPSLGIELGLAKFLRLRGGLDNGKPAFGAGLKFQRIDIDYALLTHSELGSSYRISLTGRL